MSEEVRDVISIKDWSDKRKQVVFSEDNGGDLEDYKDCKVCEGYYDPEWQFIEDEIASFEEKGWVYVVVVVKNRNTGRFYETEYTRAQDYYYKDAVQLEEVFPREVTITQYV